MFVHDGKVCKIQVITHNLMENMTQLSVYVYETPEDADSNKNHVASLVHRLPYSSEVIKLADLESIVQGKFSDNGSVFKESPIFVGVFEER